MTDTNASLKACPLPSADLFYAGKVPAPLDEECRRWLVEQLHAWPKRVNEDRTCAIGALTDMAATEFCRLMAERSRTPPESSEPSAQQPSDATKRMAKIIGADLVPNKQPMTSASETVGIVEADREAAAKALGYADYGDATDYRLTGAQDRQVSALVKAFAAHRIASVEQQAATIAERDARIEALEAALGALEPHLDAIVCYASTMGEHEPNRLVANARAALTKGGAE